MGRPVESVCARVVPGRDSEEREAESSCLLSFQVWVNAVWVSWPRRSLRFKGVAPRMVSAFTTGPE